MSMESRKITSFYTRSNFFLSNVSQSHLACQLWPKCEATAIQHHDQPPHTLHQRIRKNTQSYYFPQHITSIYIFGSPLRLESFPPASNTANCPRLMRRRLSWPFLAFSHTDISDRHCQPLSVWICSHVRQVNPKPGEVAQLGRSRRYKWKASKLQRSVRRWRSSPERLPC